MPSQEVRSATFVGLAATAMLSLLVFFGSLKPSYDYRQSICHH